MSITNNFGSGVVGGSYTPNTYTELGDMIGKIAFQVIRQVEANNPLAVFDKMPINKGDTVEQAIAKLVEANAYDSDGDGALTRDTSVKLAVRYFKNWQRHTYKTTVDISMLRKVMQEGTDVEQIASNLVSVLGQSRIYDKFQSYKALLTWGSTAGSLGASTALVTGSAVPAKSGGGIDYKAVLKKIKDKVDAFQFVSTSYNKAGIKQKSRPEDIYIVMNYELRNAIDVDELAGVFNLDKAEIKSKIIVTDAISEKKVYILDQNAILGFTRLYEMVNQLNADGLFYNYFLHIEDMFAISTLFNGYFFEYKDAE